MTPITIEVPESLIAEKARLESQLAGVTEEETKLASKRTEIQDALHSINTVIAVLSGQPLPVNKLTSATGRKPMSAEARQRIAEGLRKAAHAKALAKAAQVAPPVPEIAPGEPLAVPPTKPTQKLTPARKRARSH